MKVNVNNIFQNISNWVPIALVLLVGSLLFTTNTCAKTYNKSDGDDTTIEQHDAKYKGQTAVPGIVGDDSTRKFYDLLKSNVGNVVEVNLIFCTWWSIGNLIYYCDIQYPREFLDETGLSAPSELYYELPLYISDVNDNEHEVLAIKDEHERQQVYCEKFCDKLRFVYVKVPANSLRLLSEEMASTTHLLYGEFVVLATDDSLKHFTLSPL